MAARTPARRQPSDDDVLMSRIQEILKMAPTRTPDPTPILLPAPEPMMPPRQPAPTVPPPAAPMVPPPVPTMPAPAPTGQRRVQEPQPEPMAPSPMAPRQGPPPVEPPQPVTTPSPPVAPRTATPRETTPATPATPAQSKRKTPFDFRQFLMGMGMTDENAPLTQVTKTQQRLRETTGRRRERINELLGQNLFSPSMRRPTSSR